MTLYYHSPFVRSDNTSYRQVSDQGITTTKVGQISLLEIHSSVIEQLMATAFSDMSHLFRKDHLEGLRKILKDPDSSDNDRYVAEELLRNAVISSERVFPSCQDTGTAIVLGWKGENVRLKHPYPNPDHPDKEAISRGIYRTYQQDNLRYSQMAPLSLYREKNTKTNLPAQIKIQAEPGDQYRFLCIAKGGGSANKTFLYQKSRAILHPTKLREFLGNALRSLGTAACPPYHLAVVVGGLSAEQNLETVKLASTRFYDSLPAEGNLHGQAFRCHELEREIIQIAQQSGIGAQFGGKHFLHSVRALRLPRHAASLVVGIGVSCSADRQILAKINADGCFIENLEPDPTQYLPQNLKTSGQGIAINLDQSMKDILATLHQHSVGTRFMLSGTLIVARDVAHALIVDHWEKTGEIPEYFKNHPIYYAGPAKTPQGFASGSFGPTTSQRMDPYVTTLQKQGASLVMLGKGNRTKAVAESCARHHGFYLGSIGGPAARLGRDCIVKKEIVDHKELGMEAVWKIEVKDFPAFMITDNKGNDFFTKLKAQPEE